MRLDLPRQLLPPMRGAYLVGGAVRDMVIGKSPIDYDVAVAGDPDQFARNLVRRIGGKVVVLGKDRFNLHRVVNPHGCIDVAALQGGCIESDLRARDFTINALACPLDSGAVIDITGGLVDLDRRTIRMISAANLQSDPVRMLRAFRLAAELGFRITAETRQAIRSQAPRIQMIAGERIWTEWQSILGNAESDRLVRDMASDALLEALLPELESLRHCPPSRHHAFDAFTHTLAAYEAIEQLLTQPERFLQPAVSSRIVALDKTDRVTLKLALLLHDIGKPHSWRRGPRGAIHFHGHAALGADMAATVCRRLRTPNDIRNGAAFIIRHHQRPLFLFLSRSARAEGRFYRLCGPRAPLVLLHAMADIMGKSETLSSGQIAHLDHCRHLFTRYFETVRQVLPEPPLINGRDLMSHFGLNPSPLFRKLLDAAEEARLGGLIADKPSALRWMARYLEVLPSTAPCKQNAPDA